MSIRVGAALVAALPRQIAIGAMPHERAHKGRPYAMSILQVALLSAPRTGPV
jgi:hypothetical protein